MWCEQEQIPIKYLSKEPSIRCRAAPPSATLVPDVQAGITASGILSATLRSSRRRRKRSNRRSIRHTAIMHLAAVAAVVNISMVVSGDVERNMVYLNNQPGMWWPTPCDGELGYGAHWYTCPVCTLVRLHGVHADGGSDASSLDGGQMSL